MATGNQELLVVILELSRKVDEQGYENMALQQQQIQYMGDIPFNRRKTISRPKSTISEQQSTISEQHQSTISEQQHRIVRLEGLPCARM